MTLSWETTAFENPKLQTDNRYDIMLFFIQYIPFDTQNKGPDGVLEPATKTNR